MNGNASVASDATAQGREKQHSMNLTEKILYHNGVGLTRPYVEPGEVVIVEVARTLASELTLVGIISCLKSISNPPLWRNDRFLLACDHSVDPKNYRDPIIRDRIRMCQSFAVEHNLKDYFGPNESILHTEFYRQRGTPGTVIVGADSHSCAHGALGALAIGLGASDVCMPLVTGKTWLKVPDTVLIEFTGELRWGFTGKDVILGILRKYRRNTIGLDRCVEFGGCVNTLSVDSRFAIANMATEFGAIAGVFPADEETLNFMAQHRNDNSSDRNDQCGSLDLEETKCFRADPDAAYFARLSFDLGTIQSFTVARWPNPDDVFDIGDPALYEPLFDGSKQVCQSIRYLDGCFIGACTTTESEIILAGLLLEVMMAAGRTPRARGGRAPRRQVTPGSRRMEARLEKIGILDIYRKAGFRVGAPGCSYCLGVAHDKAEPYEVWLSSQNRNFKNRMGKGAIGSITSAVVVAASSFSMEITDPSPFMKLIDRSRFDRLTRPYRSNPPKLVIDEPCPRLASNDEPTEAAEQKETDSAGDGNAFFGHSGLEKPPTAAVSYLAQAIAGKVQRFGASVDTDAILPAEFIPLRGRDQGEKAFSIARPQFLEKVREGNTIVVAEEGFGCGSSREEAASCLVYAGVQAVVAKSFSFIFGRNLLTVNLFGVVVHDEEFYRVATEGTSIEIDIPTRRISVIVGDEAPHSHSRPLERYHSTFQLSPIQEHIYRNGGLTRMYCREGPEMFRSLITASCTDGDGAGCRGEHSGKVLAW